MGLSDKQTLHSCKMYTAWSPNQKHDRWQYWQGRKGQLELVFTPRFHEFANPSILTTRFGVDCTKLKETNRHWAHCVNAYCFANATKSALDDGRRWRMRLRNLNKARAHSLFFWALTALLIISASPVGPVPLSRPRTTLRWLLYPHCNEVFYPTMVYYSFIDWRASA